MSSGEEDISQNGSSDSFEDPSNQDVLTEMANEKFQDTYSSRKWISILQRQSFLSTQDESNLSKTISTSADQTNGKSWRLSDTVGSIGASDGSILGSKIQDATNEFLDRLEIRKLRRARMIKMEILKKQLQEKKNMEDRIRKEELLRKEQQELEEKNAMEKRRMKMSEMRELAVMEITETENSYVDSLNTLVEKFLSPLEAKVDEILTAKHVRQIFSNIRAILDVNTRFANAINERTKEWNDSKSIGDIFIEYALFFKLYKEYINNHEEACDLVRSLLGANPESKTFLGKLKGAGKVAKNKKFIQFLREVSREVDMPLASYLIMPIQRIPRYRMLLTEVRKNTPQDHDDFEKISLALEYIMNVADGINEAIRSTENSNATFDLQKRFVEPLELFGYNRILRKQGRFTLKYTSYNGKKKTKKQVVILFSDMILIAKELKNGKLEKKELIEFDERVILVDPYSPSTLLSPLPNIPTSSRWSITRSSVTMSSPSSAENQKGDEGESDSECEDNATKKKRKSTYNGQNVLCTFLLYCRDGRIEFEAASQSEKEEWYSEVHTGLTNVYLDLALEAAVENNVEVITSLCQTGFDLNSRESEYGNNCLMLAAKLGHTDVIHALVEKGTVDLNLTNNQGQSALILAICNGQDKSADLLLRLEADPNIVDKGEYNALMHLASMEDFSKSGISSRTLDAIIAKADLNQQTSEGHTVFMIACQYNNLNLARRIPLNDIDMSKFDEDGINSFAHAVLTENVDLVDRILEIFPNMINWNKNSVTTIFLFCLTAGNIYRCFL